MTPSVLIVDDDPSFRDLAERILEAAGLDVVSHADTAAAGISAAEELEPDAILLDVMLPDAEGVASALELSSLPWAPRVLLTSSSADAVGAEEVESSGAVGFIPKNELPGAPLEQLLGAA